MRLDKFVGRSKSDSRIKVYHNNTGTLLFDINDSWDYSKIKGYMKNYEVCSFEAFDNCLIVFVKERKNG
jgi:hypothetical protein